MGKHEKPAGYAKFRKAVLDYLKQPSSYPVITREQFVEWPRIEETIAYQNHNSKWSEVYYRYPEGKYQKPEGGPARVVTRTKTIDLPTQQRNRQLATLYVVMEDLVKAGILTRNRRSGKNRYCTKYIQWTCRVHRDNLPTE